MKWSHGFIVTVLLLAVSGSGTAYAQCFSGLPDPQLVFSHTEVYSIGDNVFTRYRLKVSNWASYPEEMFQSDPNQTVCVSRTWINIYDGDGNRIYGFCGFGTPEHLNLIWFAIPGCGTPPSSVYIVMRDRFCDSVLVSNLVPIPDESSCGIQDADGDGLADDLDNCPHNSNPAQVDVDLDGYGAACDCNDLDAQVNPDAEEICDGADNECNGDVDDSDYDGDGILVCDDLCPDEDAKGLDADGDGCVDNCSGLANLVTALVTEGHISSELENSLRRKAVNICRKMDGGRVNAALNMLDAFRNEIDAQRGKQITGQGADTVITYTNGLEAQLLK